MDRRDDGLQACILNWTHRLCGRYKFMLYSVTNLYYTGKLISLDMRVFHVTVKIYAL
jgi:hypothetical protein